MSYWLWLLCGTALLIVEILVPHFVSIWFALAALVTGVVAYSMMFFVRVNGSTRPRATVGTTIFKSVMV